MERCECGFVYEDHGFGAVPGELVELGSRCATLLRDAVADPLLAERLTRRPEPEVWSALEYACHIRDVLLAQRERLFLTLVEECPGFAPIYRDQRASLACYAGEDPPTVADEVEMAAGLVARSFAGVSPEGASRRCVYNFPRPSERTVVWLAQHTLHEGIHHVRDMDIVTDRARQS
ncbi:MAG: DinB family protein [Acidimicrobiales bacterium]